MYANFLTSNSSTLKPWHRFSLFIIGILFFPAFMHGQTTGDIDPSLRKSAENLAPVLVDGEVLFFVKGAMSYPAEFRAKTIRKRIYTAAEDRSITIDSIKFLPDTGRIQIYAGPIFIMNVYPVDAEPDGISMELQAEIIVEKIKSVFHLYRQERSAEVIKSNIFKALVATALLILSLVVFKWLFRRFSISLTNRLKHRIDQLENVSYKIIQADQLTKFLSILNKTISGIIMVIIIIAFSDYILGLFPWTKAASFYILDLFLDPIRSIGLSFINYLPSLVFLIVIFIITRYLIKLTRLFFNGIDNGGIEIQNFDPDWAMPTYKIVKFFVIVFAVVLAFPYIPGSSTGAFQGISVFLGVLFSLGSSSFIANVVAGYSMTYRRAFKQGDRIQVNEMNGYVEEMSLMVTRLRSVKNEEIVIPNSLLLNSNVINFSARAKQSGLILHTTVGIGYETPWRQVDAMLKKAADRTQGILKDPAPFVLKKELGDFCITYEINGYCNDVNNIYIYYTELHQNILDVFNENNVQIMTPAYENDPALPKIVPKEHWDLPLAGHQTNEEK